jgi:hypothetical protein
VVLYQYYFSFKNKSKERERALGTHNTKDGKIYSAGSQWKEKRRN